MPIHDCAHTFMQLATEVLPRYMAELRIQMANATPMADFAVKGVGTTALLRHFGLSRTTRSAAMADGVFQSYFKDAQDYLRGLKVAFMQVPDPLELYLFEAYCAMELDTKEWNTFKTH